MHHSSCTILYAVRDERRTDGGTSDDRDLRFQSQLWVVAMHAHRPQRPYRTITLTVRLGFLRGGTTQLRLTLVILLPV